MAYYKKTRKANGKWYPQSVLTGRPYSTREIARDLTRMSTLTPGDIYNVLENLGFVMANAMEQGRSVHLDGIGSFYYTARSQGGGVDTPEEVNPKMITHTSVRFIPEYRRTSNRKVLERPLVSSDLQWKDIDHKRTRKA